MENTRELKGRLRAVQRVLSEAGINVLTVSDERNLRYLFGVETGRGIITASSAMLWIRDIYAGVYAKFFEKAPFKVRVYEKGAIERYFKRVKPVVVGFEDMPQTQLRFLKKKLGVKKYRVVDIVERLREVKSDFEVGLMKKSAAIARAGMCKAEELLRPGVSELSVVAEVEAEIRRLGSENPPFEGGMILASGSHGADIHAHPSLKKLGRGLVVVDLGARFRGYHSDMTRTLALGKLNRREKRIMEAVESIKDDAVDMLAVGVRLADVHNFADERIKKLGYKFHHLLGHGVGLAIHERPSLSPNSKMVFKEGMVFTIEPGVYIPNRFGVRFEDTVVLTKKGAVVITSGR